MIIVKLKGGLGNQMFQYAYAKSISTRLNCELLLDLTLLSKDIKLDNFTHRNYQLFYFKIKDKILSDCESEYYENKIRFNNKLKLTSLNTHFFNNMLPLFKKHEDYLPGYRNNNFVKNLVLEGYFQSQQYFFSKQFIAKIYELNETLLSNNFSALNILKKIKNTSSVSVHIRRGDYASNILINSIHGTCTLDYYYNAFNYFKDRNIIFYCFSDDIFWVKNNFKNFEDEFKIEYIDCTKNDIEDLYLMSKCNHNIIANSSFSWWAAWLNSSSNKIIICPDRWYSDIKLNTLNKEMIPETWIQM